MKLSLTVLEHESEAVEQGGEPFCQQRRLDASWRYRALSSGLHPNRGEATTGDGILTLNTPQAKQIRPEATRVKVKGNDY